MVPVQRKPRRLKDYDYSQNGAYFITICVQDRKPVLSRIPVGASIARPVEAELTAVGRIVDDAIQTIPLHYPHAVVDKYVIMPNHVHMIVTINRDDGRAMLAPTAESYRRAMLAPTGISEIIRQMKGYITKQCGKGLWQRSYYDHIIRDEYDHRTKWKYIDENPVRWTEDEFYTE